MAKKKRAPVEQVEVETAVADQIVEETVETHDTPSEPIKHAGVVTGCSMLNVRKMPAPKSDVINVIAKGTVVEIDKEGSMGDFYKVKTKEGIVGFCMKKFIEIL